MMRRLAVLSVVLGLAACQRTDSKPVVSNRSGSGSGSNAPAISDQTRKAEQVKPPMDLMNPPIDAVKTSSGLIYKKLSGVGDSPKPLRNDTVLINYTGWRQTTGETFFTNKGKGQPMPLALANTAPGFTEALQLMHKGESAMLWIPPSIGYKGGPPPGSVPETLVYEVDVVDIVAAPPVPTDLAAPPTALKLPSGLAYVVVKPGTGKDKVRYFDTATFLYTAWDGSGRMFDSLEMRKRPATVPPFRQAPAMEEILTSMTAGERIRVWIPAEKMQQGGKPLPGMPEGMLTYEVEMISIAKGNEPPPKPANLAKAPDDAKTTAKGVAYKVLRAGKGGPHPVATDTVKVNYTGWTTDGRMFDSSVIKGEPAEFSLGGVIVGWTDGIPMMSVGDRFRFWVPEELAFKGAPGRPQGLLVFDIELLEIKPPVATPPVEASDPGGPPADLAAPPADAKTTPKGVAYKILKAVPGAAHPKVTDTVKIEYTGWSTDGAQIDSSKKLGRPYQTSLQDVIVGWQEGIPMVGVGESARLWIPAELAYPNGGGPAGMLVFDVRLVEIKK